MENRGYGGKHSVNIKNKNCIVGGYCCICGGQWWLFDEGKAIELLHITDEIFPMFVWLRVNRKTEGFWES